ncbi:F-box/WD-40 repeat-containing protein At3g52030 [Coffea eugenioides]|uniref:F-box/WD-40 repeat-containing protein At3g52030-like isoform X1 n=1 Tax=Coffea arabica TaxID=13443 RepID=A0ABM4WXB9_COFAR|nr:F-box/WD-40 repeat-containing protein At3g52030 [Coffea eugenioides]
MELSSSGLRPPPQPAAKKKQKTTIHALSHDILCMIFTFLDLVQLIRCSAACKSWSTVINKLKLLEIQYHKQQDADAFSLPEASIQLGRSLNIHMEQIAIEQYRFALHKGPANVFQWKGHSVGVNKCRMKMGLFLTGVGDKMMRLWSAESYNFLDEYSLPDKAPLIDFDFDENKVVGLVGTRMCIWTRTGTRNIFSSRDGMFTKGLCMSYVDPEAVVGCEDGKARVFDMYSRKCSQIIKMHPGPITCLSFSDDQLLISGSSLGSISMSDISSDQQVTTLKPLSSAGIKTLCFNPRSNLLFAGSTDGHASCWDIRTLRRLWETRVSPNVLYSINHLRNDTSTLVIGGIDGIIRILDQDTGQVLSRCIVDDATGVSSRSKDRHHQIIETKKVRRLSEDVQVDRLPIAPRPPITCLAVGMQKVVTMNNDKCIRVWKFRTD